jgi:hypothetical protein
LRNWRQFTGQYEIVESESCHSPPSFQFPDCGRTGIYQVQNGMRIRELLQRVARMTLVSCKSEVFPLVEKQLRTSIDLNPFDMQEAASIIVYALKPICWKPSKISVIFHENHAPMCTCRMAFQS